MSKLIKLGAKTLLLIVGILLFLFSFGAYSGVFHETAFQLAYVFVAIDIALITLWGFIVQRNNKIKAKAWKFILGSALISVTSLILFSIVVRGLNLIDSSHGGSFFVVFSNSVGYIILIAAYLLF